MASKRNHYQILGLDRSATKEEIRRSYRKLVLEFHPDRSTAANAKERFIEVQSAYEILSDVTKKAAYDDDLRREELEANRQRAVRQQSAQTTARPRPRAESPGPKATRPDLTNDLLKLTQMITRGKLLDAEKLAQRLMKADPKQPVPYAVMGDIHRFRGEFGKAAEMYSYAAQMSPANSIYQRKHEEVLNAIARQVRPSPAPRFQDPYAPKTQALNVPAAVIFAGCCYLALSHEPAVLGSIPWVSTWTLGILMVLVLGGIAIGASLSAGNYLDPFSSAHGAALARVSPMVLLGAIAAINFWFAAALYLGIGLSQNALNSNATRLVIAVSLATLAFSMVCQIIGPIHPMQVFLWGGNVAYIGSLLGWMVADAFRE
ncbi:MAG: J domain-containing protein [Armatimonadetes bacterium]|nr:J domain-containing protein [Armatimonadota bacterium]